MLVDAFSGVCDAGMGIVEVQFSELFICFVIYGHLVDLRYWMDHCRQKDPLTD